MKNRFQRDNNFSISTVVRQKFMNAIQSEVMMKVIDFTREHVGEAAALAIADYEEERRHVLALPPINSVPDLSGFADNGLGVAAFDGNKMVGFLCCYKPFSNAYDISGVCGVFSPMGGNAAVSENRAKIYAAMYQAAGEKWIRAGAASHAVTLYAHDKEAQEQFFRYGFGLRCLDAIRPMELIERFPCEEYDFMELSQEEYMLVYPLHTLLNVYQRASPYFMNRKSDTPESFEKSHIRRNSRFFAAKHKGELCAYLKISGNGETFITESDKYRHIAGAFCLHQHRGKGVYQNLINTAITTLKSEGFIHLGVDYESFNPSGSGFWAKCFSEYTHGVVRRIDENMLVNSI